MNEPDSPAKSPLHQKDIDVMVERYLVIRVL